MTVNDFAHGYRCPLAGIGHPCQPEVKAGVLEKLVMLQMYVKLYFSHCKSKLFNLSSFIWLIFTVLVYLTCIFFLWFANSPVGGGIRAHTQLIACDR